MKLFCLNASRPFASAVAEALGIELGTHEEREFEDGEFKVRPLESVRGERVLICQTLCSSADAGVNDRLCRLLFFIGAMKDAGADEIGVLVPYLAYARKDRRTKPRDPVTTRYVATLFEAAGTDLIVTLEVHNLAAFENAFRCAKIHLDPAPLFASHFAEVIAGAGRVVVVSPDAGGVQRARQFADQLAGHHRQPIEFAFMEKLRSEGRVSGDAFAGDVRDATVIVYDDLISGGTTLVRAARACRERGATAVHAAMTHAVFAAGAADTLAGAGLASVVVTDSIGDPRARVPALGDRLVVLPAAPLFAEVLERLSARAG